MVFSMEGTAQAHPSHQDQLDRLRRVEGQVKGISKMVQDRRYCVDILTQLRAARAALRKVEQGVLHTHAEHCVADALRRGDKREAEKKIAELISVVDRFGA